MMPKVVYETIPYFYMLAGSLLMLIQQNTPDSLLMLIQQRTAGSLLMLIQQSTPSSLLMLIQQSTLLAMAGLALFSAGSLCWVTRARYRQRHGRRYPSSEYRDIPKLSNDPIDNYQCSTTLPSNIYESLPFTYLVAGILSYQIYLYTAPSYPAYLATVLFATTGLYTWLLRGYHRGYHQPHSPVLND